MNLDIEKLKSITLGCLRMKEGDNGYIAFSRLSKKQEELYIARKYAPRPFATACMKLEFYTKGGEISFDYEISPGTKRGYYSIDLLVDREFCYHIAKDTDTDTGRFVYYVPSGEAQQRVTIYFPSTACIKIKDIRLPDDYAPHKRRLKILALGDSSVQGYYPNHFQNTYANIIADKYDAEMLNQAIGGSCFDKDFLDKTEFEPDFIMVSFGGNDWVLRRFHDGESARAYFKYLTNLYPQKIVFAIIPFELYALSNKNPDLVHIHDEKTNSFDEQTFQDVRDKLLQIVGEFESIVPINAKDFVPNYSECFYSDKVHFTDLGNVLAANRILEEMKKYITIEERIG